MTDINPDHADWKKTLLIGQVIALVGVGACWLLWRVVDWYCPGFFDPFKWSRGPQVSLTADVLEFYPVFIYAAFMAVVSLSNLLPSFKTGASDEGHLAYDTVTSVLAGVWEELGYRCVFILATMIAILVGNFVWTWILILMSVLLFMKAVGMLFQRDVALAIAGMVLVVATGFLVYLTWGVKDPICWLYQNVGFPVLSFVSFKALDDILYFQGAPFLFIAAAVSANGKFRDGHKYQGFVGFINAWVMGFVFLYAMLYYGLATAVVIHVIYDLEFAGIRYLGRKVDRLQKD